MRTLVVISHYNAWAPDQLVALLDQLVAVPAGASFDTCVVVNQAKDEPLTLPERHSRVAILYRENSGYNIGAWDHGWRSSPAYDCYLFLQEECRIARPGWLAAHRRAAMRPSVGAVGESLHWRGRRWPALEAEYRRIPPQQTGDGQAVPYPDEIRAGLQASGIAAGRTGAHLQTLVICMRREVLVAIDGFRLGRSYAEAVRAEVALSKQVEALGLKVREVGPGSFRYVGHRQWADRAGIKRAAGRMLLRWLPRRLADRIRSTHDRTPAAEV